MVSAVVSAAVLAVAAASMEAAASMAAVDTAAVASEAAVQAALAAAVTEAVVTAAVVMEVTAAVATEVAAMAKVDPVPRRQRLPRHPQAAMAVRCKTPPSPRFPESISKFIERVPINFINKQNLQTDLFMGLCNERRNHMRGRQAERIG